MFYGLSAFPLTPMDENKIDEKAFINIINRLVESRVDSIGVLGSTGNYMYLSREERLRIIKLAVENADGIPVITGVGGLRTRDVLSFTEDAQNAGAQALLLAPVSYQKLTEEEVYSLYKTVTHNISIPLCVYDNPGTTNFEFSDELHGQIAHLPHVQSIKIPGITTDSNLMKKRIAKLRSLVPPHVSIGISGDPFAVTGLNAGCEVWYSVLGGLFPNICKKIIVSVKGDNLDLLLEQFNLLKPLWSLFEQYGSLRVITAAAELEGLINNVNLPLPLKPLNHTARNELKHILERLPLE